MKDVIKIPEFMLPQGVEYKKWAVIACDQFTSQPDYWEKVEKEVGDAPSTLRLIFPEVYLGKDDEKRIAEIGKAANSYLESGVLGKTTKGFVLIERTTPYAEKRLGLLLCVDLEEYSYHIQDMARIRATEATIPERIPPRVIIRKGSPVELPHILLLMDDEKRSVIEPLYEKREQFDKLYDFDLMAGGGHIRGYLIPETEDVLGKLYALVTPARMMEKYGNESEFLFAVGDGNHSLATAKTCWDAIKQTLSEEERLTHPARFALCELENIYDEGLCFEPIHRLVLGVDVEKFVSEFAAQDSPYRLVSANAEFSVALASDLAGSIRVLDEKIAAYIKKNGGKVDYVHGEDDVIGLAKKEGGVAFVLPKMDKADLFVGVAKHGNLPKKTFSMGEAVEKRYYLEAKMIAPSKK